MWKKGANCHNRRLTLQPYQATFPHKVPICTKNYPGLIIIYSHKTGFLFNMEWIDSLTLIPLGYFEDLSPLGGGGGDILASPPPPSDLGN